MEIKQGRCRRGVDIDHHLLAERIGQHDRGVEIFVLIGGTARMITPPLVSVAQPETPAILFAQS